VALRMSDLTDPSDLRLRPTEITITKSSSAQIAAVLLCLVAVGAVTSEPFSAVNREEFREFPRSWPGVFTATP
jgi:hypothetical protein